MSSDTLKKGLIYSNPVTAGFQVVKQATGKDYTPKVSAFGATVNLANLTSGQTGIMEVMDVATQVETNRQKAVAEEQAKKDLKQDAANFEAFKAQEQSLLSDPSTPIFTPKYRRNAGIASQTEAIANLFNARRQEALSRSSMPGISQTRMR
jgi:hypothetical protein